MKQKLCSLFLIVVLITLFTSCDNKTGGSDQYFDMYDNWVYVLNNGNYASNDANLAIYIPEAEKSDKVMLNCFKEANGKNLGDLAQDMLVYKERLYIAVYNSKILFVTDLEGKILGEIVATADGKTLSPRQMTVCNDKLYVTYYEGYLGEVNISDFSVRTIKVGDNPEGVVAYDGLLYVANSGGMNYPVYGNTVNVINSYNLEILSTIEVVENPADFVVTSNGLFLISLGNYADVPSTLQLIDPQTNIVTKLMEDTPVTAMCLGANEKLYFISSVYSAEGSEYSIGVFNTSSLAYEGEFIKDGTKLVNDPTSISFNQYDGTIFIGTTDYRTTGDMYVFSSYGKLVDSFDTGGLNPVGVFPYYRF